MAGFNYTFDAAQYAPEQSAGAHPIGKFAAVISNTELKPIKDDPEGRPRFVVEFTTEAGRINMGYNLWSNNMKAVDISHKQLSALSHATGIFRIDMNNEGAALKGARLMIEVGKQKEGDYTEVKRVFDAAGNEPGRGPVTQQPPQAPNGTLHVPVAPAATVAASQPMQTPAAAPQAWGNPAASPNAAPSAPPAWGGQLTQAAPQQAPNMQTPAWTQQGGGGGVNGTAAQAAPWMR